MVQGGLPRPLVQSEPSRYLMPLSPVFLPPSAGKQCFHKTLTASDRNPIQTDLIIKRRFIHCRLKSPGVFLLQMQLCDQVTETMLGGQYQQLSTTLSIS